MFDQVRRRMRRRVLAREYVMRRHAVEEMLADDLTVWDVEQVIQTGRILERQVDTETREKKYRVRGSTVADGAAEVIAKLGPTGKVYIVTVYKI